MSRYHPIRIAARTKEQEETDRQGLFPPYLMKRIDDYNMSLLHTSDIIILLQSTLISLFDHLLACCNEDFDTTVLGTAFGSSV